MKTRKYLVRPNDMMIFEIDESNGCYETKFGKDIKNKTNAADYFTYENLTQNYHFFPIDEQDLEMFEFFNSIYYKFLSWQYRPDGHGGAKGGTFAEFIERQIFKND